MTVHRSRFRLPPAPLLRAALLLLAAGCAPKAPASPWSAARLARMTLREKVAQLVVVQATLPAPGPAADSARQRLLAWARGGLGGVQLRGPDAAAAAALSDSLHRIPLPPLLLADAERGLAASFPAATELPPLDAVAATGDEHLAREVGAALAADARAVGIDLLRLGGPALPGPEGAPAPAASPEDAGKAWAALLAPLGDAGVLASLGAFAYPGAAARAPVLHWDAAALEVTQLGYLDAVVQGGAAALEPGWVALPALTGDSTPLALSGVAVQGVLRRDRGFGGLVVVEVGRAGPLARRWGSLAAATGALQVGADLLVGVDDPAPLVDSLTAAVQRGTIPAANVERAVRRVFAAKRRAGLGVPPADSTRPTLASTAARETGLRALRRTGALWGSRSPLRGCRQAVLVTRPETPLPALSAALAARIPSLLHLGTAAAARRGALSRIPGWAGNAADCAVVVSTAVAHLPVVERLGAAARRDTSRSARRDTARFRADSAAFVRDTVQRRVIVVALGEEAFRPPAQAASVLRVRGSAAVAQRLAAAALLGMDTLAAPVRAAWPPARTLVRGDAAAAGMSADTLARIDAILQRGVDTGVYTSAAVAVARHGRLVKLRGYGRVAGGPVDPQRTLFDLASLTKVVGTTAAAMALVDDGRLELDAPVGRYLSGFHGGGKGDVTIWHLLTHTSGLPAGADLYAEAANREEALRRVMRTELVAEPGKQVLYSDFGMILLAEVIARRTGEPVERFAARRVFVPLGMENTEYRPPLPWWGRTVPAALRSERPYALREVVHDGNAFRLGGVAGHAGLFSTAGDLAVYAQTLLNLGAYGDRRIWSTRTVTAFTHKQSNAATRGLGWDTPARRSSSGDYFSSLSYGHTGFTGTSIWIDPARDLLVVLLTNRTYDTGTQGQILDIRRAVADAAARAITDVKITPRPGTPAAEAAAAAERARQRARHHPRRPTRGRHTPARRSTRRRH